jgi:hypothetical protein
MVAGLSAFMVWGVLAIWTAACAGTYTHHLTFSEEDVSYEIRGGYDLVSLDGARWRTCAGEPQLPLIAVRIALPAGCEVVDLAIVDADSVVLPGDFLVWPAQPPQSLSSRRPAEFVEPHAPVYESFDIYPEGAAELVGWGKLGGATVCEVLVYPLRYIPAQRRLYLHTSITLEVVYRWGVPASEDDIGESRLELIGSLIIDPGNLWEIEEFLSHDASHRALGGDPIAYLIVTRDSLRTYFEPLREWKTRKGIPAEIVTIETIIYTYGGSDLQEKIRNCIKDYHNNSGTDWVLLGGDTQIIPDREAYVSLSDRPYIPCDLYYSDLDGTWNDDGDLLWGEVPQDDIDMYADVYVGRAPVVNGAEVQVFVEKVLTYEGFYEAEQDHHLEMLFIGEILWGEPGNPLDEEYTDAGIAKDLIDLLYVPARFSIDKLYESAGNLNYANVMSTLNQGRNIINILTHGQYTSMSMASDVVTNGDFASLQNTPEYGLMYSACCFAGGFDQTDCIGEIWVTGGLGGGFFIGNSRYGYNSPGFPGEGPSDYYDQSFFESVFLTGFTNLGKAHADAKHEFVADSRTDDYMRYIMYTLNLLGDPETRLWTDSPDGMEVSCESQIEIGPQTYSVNVTAEGSPLAGATVCLYKPDDVYCVEETDGTGSADISIDPASAGTLFVTVTKPNVLPFAGEATVTEDPSPPRPTDFVGEEQAGPSVALRWSRVTDQDLSYYKIYRNTSPSPESLATVPGGDTTYTDVDVVEGILYYYWVSSVDSSGNESAFSEVCSLTVDGMTGIPGGGVGGLHECTVSPNPFETSVYLAFPGGQNARPRIAVYDIKGRRVGEVRPERIGEDGWGGRWDGTDTSGKKLPPGIYFVTYSTDSQSSTQKVILLR